MIPSQSLISSPVIIRLSLTPMVKFKVVWSMQLLYITIPFVLENYPVGFLKYFNVVLPLPAWNNQHFSEC